MIDASPQSLYHGSQNRNIEEFQPRAKSVRHPDEGPVVFATTSEAEASKFLVPCNDSWSKLGSFTYDHEGKSKTVSFAVYSDRKKFDENDKGGSIYTFSPERFGLDPVYAVRKSEWTSKVPVKPLSKIDFESGLEAMLSYSVQVFFVDSKTWERIKLSDDGMFEILKTQVSENTKSGINAQTIP
jgi:hypothetical protein